MAKKGSSKYRSVVQEDLAAMLYQGKRSPSSGAADTDAGDVRTTHSLIECKTAGRPGVEIVPQLPRFVKWLEKVALEAWEEGRDPALFLRYYRPDSRLADRAGWVDVVVRPLVGDVLRENAYAKVHQE
jgi:hypothetical protein